MNAQKHKITLWQNIATIAISKFVTHYLFIDNDRQLRQCVGN